MYCRNTFMWLNIGPLFAILGFRQESPTLSLDHYCFPEVNNLHLTFSSSNNKERRVCHFLFKYRIHPASCVCVWMRKLYNETHGPPFLTHLFDPALSKGGAFTVRGGTCWELQNMRCVHCPHPLWKATESRSNSSVTKPLQAAWTKRHIFNSDFVFSLVSANFIM